MKNLLVAFLILPLFANAQRFYGDTIGAGVISKNIQDMPPQILTQVHHPFEIRIIEDSMRIYIWMDTSAVDATVITIDSISVDSAGNRYYTAHYGGKGFGTQDKCSIGVFLDGAIMIKEDTIYWVYRRGSDKREWGKQ